MSGYDVVPVSADDYKTIARKRLPRFLYNYIEGGACAEETLARNVQDFNQIRLKQYVMRDVSQMDVSSTLLGHNFSMPLALAPIGMAGLFARRGESMAASAANKIGVPFTLSCVSICSVEEVQQATGKPVWFQLYMLKDRGLVKEMLNRAQQAGCTTLVFTVDLALPGLRLRDYRNGTLGGGFKGKISQLAQLLTRPGWLYDIGIRGKPHSLGNLQHKVASTNDLDKYKAFVDSQFDPTATWQDLAWLRQHWHGKILIKGIMELDDARAAVDVGADGIVLSNHGGRQLDGTSSTIDKLWPISQQLRNHIDILLDGGIRNGVDVVKAVALGAKGVLIGRPWVYAMAAQGQAGVESLLAQFHQEIISTMGLMGVTRLEQLTPELIE